ncbi:two-component system sensor histidine kinase NtrB [Desulfovermiculus halophilus]|jgi:signal transduction histidine kinase|uniref:two-component system sensor histidine kinase NtrB n=1 Tax=Desulfovermiculus halophilus TaxID=339722 RepID=UPI0004814F60|nr:ATP-binding protein [Desulfovermiculus halophilus]
MAVRVCLARLVFLVVLLLPLGLTWLATPGERISGAAPAPSYQLFLVAGFSLTILFLLLRNRFSNRILFFWVQLGADLALTFFLILITGGLKSNFAFIGLALLFLYGRTLGMHAANVVAACLALLYLVLAVLQTTQVSLPMALHEASLYASLHVLSLALMLLLVQMNSRRMQHLLQEMTETEMHLRRSEALKRKVLDWMPSGLLVLDPTGRISTINPQALAWAPFEDIRQAVSRSVAEIFPGLHTLWAAWDGQTPLRSEFTHRERLFGATLTRLPEARGSLILFTDITRIKELEAQVKEMEKMAAVGELAAGLAHEIKNPLSGIKTSLQLLPSSRLSEDKRRRLYRIVEDDVQRLNHLLTNFLAFARPKEARAQKINLAQSVHSCLFTLQSEFAHVQFAAGAELDSKTWTWDPDHLHQVLLNLLINAAQAASENEHPRVEIRWGEGRDTEYIAIADNGPGLDPTIADRLFDPFSTTKAEGSGLGLSIAQRLAHQNQANISFTRNTEWASGVTALISTRHPSGPGQDSSSPQHPGVQSP